MTPGDGRCALARNGFHTASRSSSGRAEGGKVSPTRGCSKCDFSITVTERPARTSVIAAAAPAGPPPRTTTSHSGDGRIDKALIFDVLDLVRGFPFHDEAKLRPALRHVGALPVLRDPLDAGLLAPMHLIGPLARPPIGALGRAAVVEIRLP